MEKNLNKLTIPAKDYAFAHPPVKHKATGDIKPVGVTLRKSTKTPEQITAEIEEALGMNLKPFVKSQFVIGLMDLVDNAGLECVISHAPIEDFTRRAGFDPESKDGQIFAFGCVLANELVFPLGENMNAARSLREYGRAMVHGWRKKSLDQYYAYLEVGIADGLIPRGSIGVICNLNRFVVTASIIFRKD